MSTPQVGDRCPFCHRAVIKYQTCGYENHTNFYVVRGCDDCASLGVTCSAWPLEVPDCYRRGCHQ